MLSTRYVVIATVTIVLVLGTGCGRATPMPPTDTPTPTATPELTVTPAIPLPPSSKGIGDLHITIVYDNMAYDPSLRAEWGFAALVEYGDHTLLFDTGGDGPTLLGNMDKLGLDPQTIETVVLSHEHGDHTGGLQSLLDTGVRPTVYVPSAFPASFKDGVRAHTDLVEVTDALEILSGVHSTGELGGVIVEQALVIETRAGLVVITGCAHPGIVDMVRQARELVGDEVALVIGGFHLGSASQSKIERIIADFRQLGVKQVSPTHCTGEKAIAMFADEYGDDYVEAGLGRVIVVGPATETPEPTASEQGFLLENVGFSTPESVLYDPEADLYLVANINGNPEAKDGNGFISRLSPTGEIVALKWIDGATGEVSLNAPKGMALFGEALFVTDIDVVRVFDRATGAFLDQVPIPGASFLNDVAAAENGMIYVTDSALDTIYRVAPDHTIEQLAQGEHLGGPNGIQVRGETILIADGRGRVYELGDDGRPTAEREAPAGGLDGLVLLDDETILVSSWDGSAVYRFDPAGQVSELFGGIPAPADIGFDTRRSYVLIPHFRHDRVEARPLPR